MLFVYGTDYKCKSDIEWIKGSVVLTLCPPLVVFYIYVLKVEKGGEDAFFVSSDNGGVIVVADGVSG